MSNPSRWFRLHHEVVSNQTLQGLEPDLFRMWINLRSLTAGHDGKAGKLPSTNTIALRLRMSPADVERGLAELRRQGVIEPLPGWGGGERIVEVPL